ncbi:hypothetical protein CC1G_14187 [Coprinopsis cinerea okayama7|uniref:C2H2-type domain-containing protein n=1 Tax=Coprinopsis cinerea (strain Okayama-7 / 130 / ATCC MYA-4618 / FGSC 9003) TaxID=240176 RepID=D6RLD3_COPC7|nr:hypothetical protein CC1G_14187 [Coprinopsis cinerea okayama7\|eukprot:XP_002911654.1 hypothetical protein CC1G_14187 [Coprinopsis cinerea okayama7\
MTERRYSSQYQQWNEVAQPYLNTHNYPSSTYHSSGGHHSSSSAVQHPVYNDESSYSATYYPTSTSGTHSPDSPVYPSPISSSGSDGYSRYHDPPRPDSTRPMSHHPYSHSQSYTYSPSSSSPHPPNHPYARPRSHSQAYPTHETISLSPPQSSHYHQQIPLSPAMPNAQYPTPPARPFACDLCALSFNRQHDLKRHRETHTGEKPFLCNGGCGKTFTRKDALKRHQLVKGCGKVEDGRS